MSTPIISTVYRYYERGRRYYWPGPPIRLLYHLQNDRRDYLFKSAQSTSCREGEHNIGRAEEVSTTDHNGGVINIMREGGVIIGWCRRYSFSVVYKTT
jgi:hypothetical protein